MPATHPHAGCIALALGRWHVVDRQLALIRGLPKGDAHESGGLQLEPDQGSLPIHVPKNGAYPNRQGPDLEQRAYVPGQQPYGPPHHVIVLNEAKDIERATNRARLVVRLPETLPLPHVLVISQAPVHELAAVFDPWLSREHLRSAHDAADAAFDVHEERQGRVELCGRT